MENKKFIITVIVICLLIGGVVWQQVNIVEIKSQLIGLESPASEVQSVITDVAEVKSILTNLAEIESELDLNEKTQETAQNVMLMAWTDSHYFMATHDWEQASSRFDLYSTLNDTMTSLITEHDELMAQKIALLEG